MWVCDTVIKMKVISGGVVNNMVNKYSKSCPFEVSVKRVMAGGKRIGNGGGMGKDVEGEEGVLLGWGCG